LAEIEQSLAYAHARNSKLLLAVNTFPPAGKFDLWRDAIDGAARLSVDAVIVADMGVADYAARTYPDLRLHLSVQAGASSPEAIRFYCEQFGVKRVVLPRMLTVAEIAELHSQIPCEIEAFIFGNIGMMAEGRCSLSNYVTGESTNMDGVCSPAAAVHYEEDAARNLTTRLGDYVIDCFAGGESAGYPTICKGRYLCGAQGAPYYAFEEPVSLNLSALLPDLMRAGVTALKIEGRQRSRAYVKSVVGAFRKAVDDIMAGREAAFASLLALTEGRRETEGAFPSKRWR
jgi:putative protease